MEPISDNLTKILHNNQLAHKILNNKIGVNDTVEEA